MNTTQNNVRTEGNWGLGVIFCWPPVKYTLSIPLSWSSHNKVWRQRRPTSTVMVPPFPHTGCVSLHFIQSFSCCAAVWGILRRRTSRKTKTGRGGRHQIKEGPQLLLNLEVIIIHPAQCLNRHWEVEEPFPELSYNIGRNFDSGDTCCWTQEHI